MSSKNLSTIAGLNLLRVSLSLTHRTASVEVNQEVGEYGGRFYLLDFTMNKCHRITWGAFKHLTQAWKTAKLEVA